MEDILERDINEDSRGRLTTGEGEIEGLGEGESGGGDVIDSDNAGPAYVYPEAEEEDLRDEFVSEGGLDTVQEEISEAVDEAMRNPSDTA